MDVLPQCPADSAEAGRAVGCGGCPGQALCQSQGKEDPDQSFIDIRMRAIKHKILVLSGKGGVGKSSVAAALALGLGGRGYKVGVCDLDLCGPSIPRLLGVTGQQVTDSPYGWQPALSPHHGIKVMSAGLLLDPNSAVVFRGPRKTALIKRFLKDTLWGKLDYLIFDTPPGTSDEHLSVVKYLGRVSPEGAVMVTTPQLLALQTVRKEMTFCRKMKLRVLGLVENMGVFVCPCCQEECRMLPVGPVEKVARDFGVDVLASVPLDKSLSAACERGEDVMTGAPDAPAVVTLQALVTQLCSKVGSL